MDRSRASRLLLLAVLTALGLVVAACTSGSGTTTTTAPGGTTTSTDGTTSTSSPTTSSIPGSASDSLDPAVVEAIRQEIGELIEVTEEIRGLPFLEVPTVTILDEQEFGARVADLIEEDLDEEETAVDARAYSLVGLQDPSLDLYTFLIDVYTEQVAGFYDGGAGELVVPADQDGLTALQKLAVVHELIHALTDQHFDHYAELEARIDDGVGDDTSALLALLEGDATYFQFIYLQQLSPLEAVQAAAEALTIDTTILDAAPSWLRADLAFPYDHGLTFVGDLVSSGGIAAVDEAYQQLPATTEQVLDAAKYLRNEEPAGLPELTVALDGWEIHQDGTWGEWGLRLLFMDTLSPGMATQTASGWGADHYRVLSQGDDVAVVLHYLGETEQDAEEVADAFIAHARGPMEAGPAVESGGGLLYDQGAAYYFLDRVEDEVFFIASTDAAAGASLRAQLDL